VTLTSLLTLHQILNRAAIEIMTCDRLGMTVPMPAVGETPVGTETQAGTWPDAAAAAGRAGQENFPVALRMLPRRYREHLMAVYTYARVVDDAGDAGPPGERAGLLHELETDLRRLYGVAGAGSGSPRHAAVRGLADVVASCGIPIQPFLDLIRAGEQDQVVTRYETFEELVDYCRLSANPVGRIVLHVFGCASPAREPLSDAICTGLQLAEHLQDVAEDMRAGRVYLPAADMRLFGCSEQDLQAASAAPRLRKLIAAQTRRAAEHLDAGAPLIGTLRGMPRAAIAGYVAGGRAALAAIARADYDVLAATPRPAKTRTAVELISAYATAR
jgi:squalene synthase HpnC